MTNNLDSGADSGLPSLADFSYRATRLFGLIKALEQIVDLSADDGAQALLITVYEAADRLAYDLDLAAHNAKADPAVLEAAA